MEEENTSVVLIDDDGEEVSFTHVMTFEHNNSVYVALVPQDMQPSGNEDEEEVVILRVETDEAGEDTYVTVDDDDELEAAYIEFVQILDEEDA